jgi:uncharacterized protein YdeI (YjbR/CyaY-like superfamily)
MSHAIEPLILRDPAAWRRWLARHFAQEEAVWLLLARKGTSDPTSLTYDDALEEAICHGWIDGQVRRRDEATYMQRFSARRAKSAWSARNVALAERLAAEGRMHAAGREQVQRAKADGRWERAYAGPASIQVPEDLRLALSREPAALASFEGLSSQNRYSILYRLQTLRGTGARAARIERYVAMLARGETIYAQGGGS